jgi:hypothetical protein
MAADLIVVLDDGHIAEIGTTRNYSPAAAPMPRSWPHAAGRPATWPQPGLPAAPPSRGILLAT